MPWADKAPPDDLEELFDDDRPDIYVIGVQECSRCVVVVVVAVPYGFWALRCGSILYVRV